MRDLDRNLPLYKIATMEQNLGDSLMRRRFAMLLLATLAGIALSLAALGEQPGTVLPLIKRQGCVRCLPASPCDC